MEQESKESSQTTEKKESTWSRMITPHGEVDIETTADGREIYHALKTEELKPLPPAVRTSHISEMALFHSILTYLQKHQPKRNMPVTRNEYIRSGADPDVVKKLVDHGLLKECLIAARTPDGRNKGSRACYYYTDQGRALIRAKVDPSYAITENI